MYKKMRKLTSALIGVLGWLMSFELVALAVLLPGFWGGVFTVLGTMTIVFSLYWLVTPLDGRRKKAARRAGTR